MKDFIPHNTTDSGLACMVPSLPYIPCQHVAKMRFYSSAVFSDHQAMGCLQLAVHREASAGCSSTQTWNLHLFWCSCTSGPATADQWWLLRHGQSTVKDQMNNTAAMPNEKLIENGHKFYKWQIYPNRKMEKNSISHYSISHLFPFLTLSYLNAGLQLNNPHVF